MFIKTCTQNSSVLRIKSILVIDIVTRSKWGTLNDVFFTKRRKLLSFKIFFFKIYYITQAHMCNISRHNNIIQYVNIENMGDREGIYLRLIYYIQYTLDQHLRLIGINH